MSNPPDVVIVMAKCARNREPFGVRFEEKSPGQWLCDWAFAVKPATARREGYDRGEVRGSFAVAAEYPGCPHCRARMMFKCGCGKTACWSGEGRSVTCPWCGATGELSGTVTSMGAGADR